MHTEKVQNAESLMCGVALQYGATRRRVSTMTTIRTLSDLQDFARKHGLPSPVVLTNGAAVIPFELDAEPVQAGPARAKALDVADFTAWVESVGGWQNAANWLNGRLATKYTRADVFRWGHPEQESGRPIPAKVRKLLTSQKALE